MARRMVPYEISVPELARLERGHQVLNTLRSLVQRAREERPAVADLPLTDVGFVRKGEQVEVRLYFEEPEVMI